MHEKIHFKIYADASKGQLVLALLIKPVEILGKVTCWNVTIEEKRTKLEERQVENKIFVVICDTKF